VGVAARWGLAVVLSAAAFAVSWWVSAGLAGLDEGAAIGVASAVLAVVLAVAAWWAARERPGSGAGSGVNQHVRAGRDAYTAGRDQAIHRRPDG
jgi:hypothetical protein